MSTWFKLGAAAVIVSGLFVGWTDLKSRCDEALHIAIRVEERLVEVEARVAACEDGWRLAAGASLPVREIEVDSEDVLGRLDVLEAAAESVGREMLELEERLDNQGAELSQEVGAERVRRVIGSIEQNVEAVTERHFAWTPWQVMSAYGRPDRIKTDGDNNEVCIWHYYNPGLQKTLLVYYWHGVFAKFEIEQS